MSTSNSNKTNEIVRPEKWKEQLQDRWIGPKELYQLITDLSLVQRKGTIFGAERAEEELRNWGHVVKSFNPNSFFYICLYIFHVIQIPGTNDIFNFKNLSVLLSCLLIIFEKYHKKSVHFAIALFFWKKNWLSTILKTQYEHWR